MDDHSESCVRSDWQRVKMTWHNNIFVLSTFQGHLSWNGLQNMFSEPFIDLCPDIGFQTCPRTIQRHISRYWLTKHIQGTIQRHTSRYNLRNMFKEPFRDKYPGIYASQTCSGDYLHLHYLLITFIYTSWRNCFSTNIHGKDANKINIWGSVKFWQWLD